jgi:uncharacterized protein
MFMAQLSFKTLSFKLDEKYLRVNLLRTFYCKIPLSELKQIGYVKLDDQHTLDFNSKKADTKFSFLLTKHFDKLKNSVNGNDTIYIHQNSGIPLIGHVSFGIAYRNSSLIEIKPVTSCNLDCIYCSVGEGKRSEKIDFVVEKDYLIQELQKLLNYVDEPIEIHIGVQGEPFLYADLIPLIEDLNKNKQITIVSMDTNFTLVTKEQLDKLAKFEKLRFNISLDAMEPELATKLVGAPYNLEKVLEMIRYAVKKKIKILIAPVLIPGYNEQEMEKIVNFVKEIGIKHGDKHPNLGIQNFLNYKTGRNPTKAWKWEEFYQFISDLEKKTSSDLKLNPDKFGIRKVKALEKPFKVGDEIYATLRCPDRFKGSSIAVAKGRVISVPGLEFKKERNVRLKILKDKHNMFTAKVI